MMAKIIQLRLMQAMASSAAQAQATRASSGVAWHWPGIRDSLIQGKALLRLPA
ncbi:MAG: hypothetical protein I4O49_03565 [Janthinobacterium lividum]|nr:hypothetical protein [Janthinobacterium lividum]